MFRPRSALALLIGIAAIVPSAAYATPTTPDPTPAPSVTVTETPTAPPISPAGEMAMTLITQPKHAFDPAEVQVRRPNGVACVLTTTYGYQQRLAMLAEDVDGTPSAGMLTETVFVPSPEGGWKSGRDYTVTATPEKGAARRVTIRMEGDGVERDQRMTITAPTTSTAPVGVRLDGVRGGLPVAIGVHAADNPQMTYAYVTTMTTSSTNYWSILSADGAQVDPADYQRWHPGRVYLVRVSLGPEPDVTTWQRTFQMSSTPDKPAPTIPRKPIPRPKDVRGGLAGTGW